MRVSLACLGLLFLTSSAYAQAPCAPGIPHYDPYNPSQAAIMREYGGTILAQAPVSTLLKLDPYVPSQGELLRQLGRGIPVWTAHAVYTGAPMPAADDCSPSAPPARDMAGAMAATPAPLTRFGDVLDVLAELRRSGVAVAAPTASPASAGPGVERNSGVWIEYANRRWVSAGAAVVFSDADYVQVGESAGFAVYRRAGSKDDDLIFVQTSRGMVAPFRSGR